MEWLLLNQVKQAGHAGPTHQISPELFAEDCRSQVYTPKIGTEFGSPSVFREGCTWLRLSSPFADTLGN
jgi:hypothetical protein